MENYTLIIGGDNNFNDYDLLKSATDKFLLGVSKGYEIIIISDTSNGASWLGERFAAESGLEVMEFEVRNWAKHYIVRHQQMVGYANACICFWDGQSVETKHLIETAANEDLDILVVRY
ncbi:hypothetical protein SAMN05192574_102821 [Mucilaginibacter gossypiicola]|uniref:DUF2493 domain-containing protein n=1 Tax=Mucilaginibacter gossypiicola TaxID=551995 RepID=A0A1H8EU41_9SPHI|nr:hypothetical protein [Mucilaginibacter gossypiicola]SEN22268.1 hypothetical protein SAMN05192574_102821 [Mucilaginibacter gossypiicola]